MNATNRLSRGSGLRNFLVICSGQLISQVGSRLSGFALGVWVLRQTGSTTRFAFTFLAMAIPAMLISPLAGSLVDRWDRRRILIVCDVCAAAVMLIVAVLWAVGHLAIWHIYVAVAAASMCDAFRVPAFSASIALLVPASALPRANALAQTGVAVAEIIGPAVAGILVSTVSLYGVLTIDALTYVFGVATLLSARIPSLPRRVEHSGDGVLRAAAIGWRYVRQRTGLVGLLSVYGSNNFLFAIASVAIAPLLLSFTTTTMMGLQYAIGGTGLLAGTVLLMAWGGPRRRVNGVLAGSLIAGLALIAHGLRPSFALLAVAGFIVFIMFPVISASNSSLWQSKVPSDLHGRCFAMQRVLFNAATAAGYCLAGPLCEYVFEPLLSPMGPLAASLGVLIGTGPGRGIAFLFMILGGSMSVVAIAAYSVPAIRDIDGLADVGALSAPAPAEAEVQVAADRA